jgi:lipid A 4'-phosphatase
VPTIWTDVDLAAAAVFSGSTPSISAVSWWWVELINQYVPAVFRSMVLLALLGWIAGAFHQPAKKWRMQCAFIVLAAALGPGLLVNNGFKDHWQRARPYQVEAFGGLQKFTRAGQITDQCNNNCSFVSGHVSDGIFLVSLMLVFPRRRKLWAGIGIGATLFIGFARMADSAHWLSDVLWACPITLLCSWVVWKLLLCAYRPKGELQATM